MQISHNFLREYPTISKSILKNWVYVNFLLFIYFTSCKSNVYKIKQQAKIIKDSAVVLSSNPLHIVRKSNTKVVDVKTIDLQISFHNKSAELLGIEKMVFSPYRFRLDSVEFDARAIEIQQLSVEGQVVNYKLRKDKLIIYNADQFLPSRNYELNIQYTARPNQIKAKGSAAIRSAKGLYFINNTLSDTFKPFQIWTQGEPESNSAWFVCVDKPNEKFKFNIQISVPDSLQVLSNGTLISEQISDHTKVSKWQSEHDMSAYLAMMAIGSFEIVEDKWRDKQVNYYVEPAYKADAKQIFAYTPEMMECFSQLLGYAYPWEKYHQVIVHDYVSGAMENTSASLFGEFVQKHKHELRDYDNEDIVAHELFHQWFGDLVTCESWSNVVLNEGFATYGEQLWAEWKYGKYKADYKHYWSLQRYLKYVQFSDDPIVQFHYRAPGDVFTPIAYQKGSRVLNLLRYELGDSIFFEGLQRYLQTYAFGSAEVHQLRLIYEEISGQDLYDFFDQWFYKPGHPNLQLSYDRIGNLLNVSIVQKNADSAQVFRFPVEFKFINHDKFIQHKIWVDKKKDNFDFDLSALGLDSSENPIIIFDAAHNFIGEVKDDLSNEAHHQLLQLNTSQYPFYIERANSLQKVLEGPYDPTCRKTLYEQLHTANKLIKNIALNNLKIDSLLNDTLIKKVLQEVALSNEYVPNTVLAIKHLARYETPMLAEQFQQLLQNDHPKVQAQAIKLLTPIDRNASEKFLSEQFETQSDDICLAIADVLNKQNDPRLPKFLIHHIPRKFSGTRKNLLNLYFEWLKKQDEKTQEAGLAYLSRYSELDNIGSLKESIEAYKKK